MVLKLVILSMCLVKIQTEFPSSLDRVREVVELGKQQYNNLNKMVKESEYGECWKVAVENLHDGCHRLTEDRQKDIALKFTNCFLLISGHETYNCYLLGGTTQKDCMQDMSDRAFNAFTEFYTHTQNICFFLKSQMWHEETEQTINRLSFASDRAAGQLEELVDNGQSLKQALADSHVNLNTMMIEFQASTLEQKRLLFDVFDRLSSLQEWAIGEISWLDSVVFYLCGVILSHLLTATPRTSDARFFMFLAFTLNIIAEKHLCYYFVNTDTSKVGNLNENLTWWVWLCRKILITICVTILSISVIRYQDYNVINHTLLVQIQEQNLKLLGFLEKVKMLEGAIPDDTKVDVDSDCETVGGHMQHRYRAEDAVITPSKLPSSPRTTAAVLRKTEQVIQSALQSNLDIEISHQPTRSSSPALSRVSDRSTASRSPRQRRRLNYDTDGSARTRYNLRHLKVGESL